MSIGTYDFYWKINPQLMRLKFPLKLFLYNTHIMVARDLWQRQPPRARWVYYHKSLEPNL